MRYQFTTTHTNIKSCTYHQFKPLPFTQSQHYKDNAEFPHSLHSIIFLKFTIETLPHKLKENNYENNRVHRSSDIGFHKLNRRNGSYSVLHTHLLLSDQKIHYLPCLGSLGLTFPLGPL